ncbi:capsular exopolysaccharide family [Mesonia phycicola]|uniref:non-specific protein-tyrosine kinase n=1 Tax=Mesonia phycicola TaxID=579105 RepID=A0A1M6H270_9FLAO|nr:tyrosine-protein kinase [Mesonia phycicola]SHJ16299.1 capsular exopolysaccharide family [Mesonia phycicola]
MSENNVASDKSLQESEDIKNIILQYLRYWPYFILSVLAFLTGAYIYLRYSTPIYNTSAKIKILKDDEGGIDLSGLSKSTTLFNYSKLNLENEIEVLKSRRLINKVISTLDLTTTYYKQLRFREQLLFNKGLPFKLKPVDDSLTLNQNFEITFLDEQSFKISLLEQGESYSYKFGDTISNFTNPIVVYRNLGFTESLASYDKQVYTIYNTSVENKISELSNKISINPLGKSSSILSSSMQGPNKERNEVILNTLVKVFNEDGIEDKRLVSKRTMEFIIDRLQFLESELDTVESGLVGFKEANDVVDVESSVEQLFSKESVSEEKRFEMSTQIAVAEEFENLMQNQDEFALLPANLGIENASINQLTSVYNDLILDRERLLISSTEENPMVLQLNEKLNQLKGNLLKNIDNHLTSLKISFQKFQSREGKYTGEIGTLPQKEKDLRNILRQQEIKERLYLFLLQKREEAALSFAITSPTLKVVDYAFTSNSPIKPSRNLILFGSFFVGLIIPVAFLYVKFLLNTKIYRREEIESRLPAIDILGEIPQLPSSHDKLVHQQDHSILAESFRILRTNLSQIIDKANGKTLKSDSNVVFVTSSIKGEGKTFTAINLSRIIASSGKKVLLLGCDLRNPQLHTYFGMEKEDITGISDYLYNPSKSLESFIKKFQTEFSNLDIIFSGSVPPNPAELLMGKDFKDMVEYLKTKYDYIVVDTAPTIYVTDTFLIANEADVTVYVVKQGLTEKKLMNHIRVIDAKNKLKNISITLNGVSGHTNFGYGYGYAYTETQKKKSIFKFK